MPAPHQTFGEALKAARAEAKLSQMQLCALAGVSQSALSGWENNRNPPTLSDAAKLAKALGVSLDSLVTPDLLAADEDDQ
jgi:transcriptional regulator with XRE-family HTH domain